MGRSPPASTAITTRHTDEDATAPEGPAGRTCARLPAFAELRRDRGKRAGAQDLLAPVCAWFTECFDTPEEAKALLDASELASSLAVSGAPIDLHIHTRTA